MYKQDLALNNQQSMLCLKTKPNKKIQTLMSNKRDSLTPRHRISLDDLTCL